MDSVWFVAWMALLHSVLLTVLAHFRLQGAWVWLAAASGWILCLAAGWAARTTRRANPSTAAARARRAPSHPAAGSGHGWLASDWNAEGESLAQIVRARRHADMNRLQVVLGWLQMGRTERASTILAEWGRQLQWEGATLRQWPTEAAVAYYAWRAACEAAGIDVAWQPVATREEGARAGETARAQPAVIRTALADAWREARASGAHQIRLAWDPGAGRLHWDVLNGSPAGFDQPGRPSRVTINGSP